MTLLDTWRDRGDADVPAEPAPLVFSRGDSNLLNYIDDTVWISLLPNLGVYDDHTRRRFLAAQRTVALRWLTVLWKRRHQRVDEFEYQFGRVRQLHRTDFL